MRCANFLEPSAPCQPPAKPGSVARRVGVAAARWPPPACARASVPRAVDAAARAVAWAVAPLSAQVGMGRRRLGLGVEDREGAGGWWGTGNGWLYK